VTERHPVENNCTLALAAEFDKLNADLPREYWYSFEHLQYVLPFGRRRLSLEVRWGACQIFQASETTHSHPTGIRFVSRMLFDRYRDELRAAVIAMRPITDARKTV
jgi:hypothetical protein